MKIMKLSENKNSDVTPRIGRPFPAFCFRLSVLLMACLIAVTLASCRNDPPPSPPTPPEESSVSVEPPPPPEESSQPEPVSEPEPEIELYPLDKLAITQERMAYQDGDIQLIIPKLELDCPVLTGSVKAEDYGSTAELFGVADKILHQGVGLFGCAQLPGPGNPNTSLSAHRDIYNQEFYHLDKMEAGDLIYLEYKGNRYTYEYVETQILNDDDWSLIYSREKAGVTLMTCHPIWIASHRMFVVADLIEVTEIIKD